MCGNRGGRPRPQGGVGNCGMGASVCFFQPWSMPRAGLDGHAPVGATRSMSAAPNRCRRTRQEDLLHCGVCLCSGDGPKTKQIAERLLAHMRQVFPLPNESGNRKRLLDGFIVLRVCGEPESYDYEDMLACEDCFADMWFHIGLHYLSPFRPAMLRVIEVDEVDGEAPREQGRRYVKVVGLG